MLLADTWKEASDLSSSPACSTWLNTYLNARTSHSAHIEFLWREIRQKDGVELTSTDLLHSHLYPIFSSRFLAEKFNVDGMSCFRASVGYEPRWKRWWSWQMASFSLTTTLGHTLTDTENWCLERCWRFFIITSAFIVVDNPKSLIPSTFKFSARNRDGKMG